MSGGDWRKFMKQVKKQAKKQGWRVDESSKNQHTKLFPPDRSKPIVVLPNTPSDHRTVQNTRRDLRNSGMTGI